MGLGSGTQGKNRCFRAALWMVATYILVRFCDAFCLFGLDSARVRECFTPNPEESSDKKGGLDGWLDYLARMRNKKMHSDNGNEEVNPSGGGVGTEDRANDVASRLFDRVFSSSGIAHPDASLTSSLWNWADHARNYVILRSQGHDFRRIVRGGNHWISGTVFKDDSQQSGVPTFTLCVRGTPSNGPSITNGPVYTNTLAVVTGGDPGVVSTSLRLNLSQLGGNVTMLHTSLVGSAVSDKMGTSTADILLRIFLMAASYSPIDDGGDILGISGTGWRANLPLEYIPTGVFFPFGSNQTVGLGANSVTALVCSVGSFIEVASGLATAVAGFGPENWGVEGPGGVAIVPIRSGWEADARGNALWALAHMEYPFERVELAGHIVSHLGNNLQAVNGWSSTGCVRVPGPHKVLFVLVDRQKSTDQVEVEVGPDTNVFRLHEDHVLVGGTVVDISPGMADIFATGGSDQNYSSLGTCIRRWNAISGSMCDWKSAHLCVSDVYARFCVNARRVGGTTEGSFWNDVTDGAPFTSNTTSVAYRKPTQTEVGTLASLCSTSTGTRYWGSYITNHGHDFTIGSHSPLVYIGLAARFYSVTTRITMPSTVALVTEMCCRWARDSKVLAALTDWFTSQYSLSERAGVSPLDFEDGGAAYIYAKKALGLSAALAKHRVPCLNWKPTFACLNEQVEGYEAIFTLSGDYTVYSRLPSLSTYVLLGGEFSVVTDDAVDLSGFGYDGQLLDNGTTGLQHYDVLARSGPEVLWNERSMVKLASAHCGGTFTFGAVTDPFKFILTDRTGTTRSPAPMVYDSPTSGVNWGHKFRTQRATYDVGDIVELPHGKPNLVIDIDRGRRTLHLAVTGSRGMLLGPDLSHPIMYLRNSVGATTGEPARNDEDPGATIFDGGPGVFR